jgi:anti-sigma factor RsiW
MTARVVCESGVALLMEYLEGTLPASVRRDLDDHVSACPRCIAFVESYRATPRILRQATLAAIPADLDASLTAFLRKRLR